MKVTWYIEDEWLEWYCMTPQERWIETEKLWQIYLSMGGSLDPQPDSQSPFDPLYSQGESTSDGRTGLHTNK